MDHIEEGTIKKTESYFSMFISQVNFVAYDDYRNCRARFRLVYLVSDCSDFFKGGRVIDVINQDEGVC